jgi:hypothetical protein
MKRGAHQEIPEGPYRTSKPFRRELLSRLDLPDPRRIEHAGGRGRGSSSRFLVDAEPSPAILTPNAALPLVIAPIHPPRHWRAQIPVWPLLQGRGPRWGGPRSAVKRDDPVHSSSQRPASPFRLEPRGAASPARGPPVRLQLPRESSVPDGAVCPLRRADRTVPAPLPLTHIFHNRLRSSSSSPDRPHRNHGARWLSSIDKNQGETEKRLRRNQGSHGLLTLIGYSLSPSSSTRVPATWSCQPCPASPSG